MTDIAHPSHWALPRDTQGALPGLFAEDRGALVVEPAVARAVGTDSTLPGSRNGTVVIYIALALLALIPGLMFRDMLEPLKDIRFGSGLRFWLGVAGATMMGLLLLYPLRKVLARRRQLGSVGGWFHVHILFGLFGPVLILYHCKFSLGALNANVALWTMLVVAISGIAGHFIYARVSSGFYDGKRSARDNLDHLVMAVRSLQGYQIPRQSLIDRLEQFETQMLTPRGGLRAALRTRWQSAVYRRHFHRDLSLIMTAVSHEQRWPSPKAMSLSQHHHALLDRYMDSVAAAAGRSILEQVWARWRLFHLPVFLVMSVAAGLHIAAVWGLDAPEANTEASAPQAVDASPPEAIAARAAAPAAPPDQIAQILANSARSGSSAVGRTARNDAAPVRIPATAATPSSRSGIPEASVPSTTSPPQDIETRLLVKPHEVAAPPSVIPAKPAQRAIPADGVSQVAEATKRAAAPRIATATEPKTPVVRPQPDKAESPTNSAPPATNAEPPSREIASTYAELRQRGEQPPMGLGAGKRVLSLGERIAELKSQNFDHAKTRFPLTGKHVNNECSDCHKTKLENTAHECVACHKEDDAHNGRRTDCAKCHTTNRWTQIIRR